MSGEGQSEAAAKIAGSIAAATPRKRKARPPPQDPPPASSGSGGGGAAGPSWEAYGLPDDCPVEALGVSGSQFYFIDASRQFRVLHYKDFGAHGLTSLFGDGAGQNWLDNAFPRYGKDGRPIGLDKELAVRSLMAACAKKGVFDADNKVRKTGAWTDAQGSEGGVLRWHFGDTVLSLEGGREAWGRIGVIAGRVYPLGAPQPRPAERDGAKQRAAVAELHDTLRLWHWKRGDLDARLLLGQLGCALIGGALRWRPATWLTGGQGVGKSTLQDEVVDPVLGGDQAVIHTSDATAAGIRQALDNRSLPIVFDEFEPNPDDMRKTKQAIEFLRQSASGGRSLRGGADHEHREFTARASFLLSSILVPPFEAQDAMRICVLHLLPPASAAQSPRIDAARMREIGRHLRRLLVDRWAIWPRRLAAWREAVRERGFSNRVADTWGTLLAMADHLLDPVGDPEVHGDTLEQWIEALKPALEDLVSSAGSDWARLLGDLMTRAVDPYQRGQRWPLSSLIMYASQREIHEDETVMNHAKATAGLEALGLRVMPAKIPEGRERAGASIWCLAVAKGHAELNALMLRSPQTAKWGGGVYAQTLENVPGAWVAQQRIAKRKPTCVMVPLDVVLPADPALAQGDFGAL